MELNLIEDNKDLLEESNESNSQIKLHSGYSSFSENVEKDFCNLRINSESSTKLFSNDENKKMQNDSTSILSDSSDGCYSENLTDSESTKKKRNRNVIQNKIIKNNRNFLCLIQNILKFRK